jgi:uncharacterized protein
VIASRGPNAAFDSRKLALSSDAERACVLRGKNESRAFTLNCVNGAGTPIRLAYDPWSGELCNVDGSSVISKVEAVAFGPCAPRISPEQPGAKCAPSVLKIQLGLGCNYQCSYCSQATEVPAAAVTRTADADAFVAGLGAWLTDPPKQIEFWGGEPLLYFAKLRRLVPVLDERFPDAEFSLVTNGTLLDDEVLEFIEHYDILVTVSHDGPGQALRGPDPLADAVQGGLLRRLWNERKRRARMVFSAVLTPSNHDPAAIRRWFIEALGDPDAAVSLEGVVAVHGGTDRAVLRPWTAPEHESLRERVAAAFVSGDALRMPALAGKARDFIGAVASARPAATLGQKCQMDRADHLAVDLSGNVLTCQNTGANGVHGLGSVTALDHVRLDSSTHWSHRECCNHCPVVQLCQGSCMYLHGEDFARSCDNEYHYNLGILDGVLRRSFGLRLLSIDGDVRRPRRTTTIPIAPVGRSARALCQSGNR